MKKGSILKILNIVPDEKFIDNQVNLYELIERSDVRNDFVCVSKCQTLTYVKNDRVKIIKKSEVIDYIKKGYTDVLLHSLYSIPIKYIPSIPNNVRVLWVSWGYDVYSNPVIKPLITIDLYGKITKEKLPSKSFLSICKSIIQYYRVKRAVSRVDLYSGIIDAEYDMMCRNSFFKAKKFSYSYGRKDSYISEDCIDMDIELGENVLLGNSADPSNNHIEAINYLVDKMKMNQRKIVLPLSYPRNTSYVESIINFGNEILGDSFLPVVDFLPFREYSHLLKSCSYVIMFHERQQALGNIQLCLWNGCKVFLSKTSVLYKYLKSMGFIIFSVQDDFCESGLQPLQKDYVKRNRELLLRYYSANADLARFNALFDLLLNYLEKNKM